MIWNSNFSLLRLSVTKSVTLYSESNQKVIVYAPIAKQLLIESAFIEFFNYLQPENFEMFQKALVLWKVETNYDWLKAILIDSSTIKEFNHFRDVVREVLNELIPDLWIGLDRTIMIRDIELDESLWEAILKVWKQANGDASTSAINKPKNSAIMKQMEEQEKILNKLKQKAGKGNVDDFLKILLWIRYAFPSYTDESLWSKTMYEIGWLQKYAAEACNYEVERDAYTNGNFKKDHKLTFFLNKK